ncbi:sulfurtransferase TusA family protein [Myxococcota bacterium]|nr:sulfurtransferase TusA family protein [Myxococcota bacterium]
MRSQQAYHTLSQWLGLPPVTQEEVAVLQYGNALSAKELHQILPASVVLIDLAALQKNNLYAHRRLVLAHAFVVLTSRSIEDTKAQMDSFRPPDAVLFTPDFSSVGLLQKEIEKTVSALCRLVFSSARAENAAIESMDYLGLKCPMPIVRLSAYVRKSNPTALDIMADDRAFPADLKAWAERSEARVEWLSSPDALPFRVRLHFAKKPPVIPAPASSSFVIKVPPELLAASTFPVSPVALASASESTSLLPPPVRELGLPLLASLDYNDKRSPLHLVALQKERKQHTKSGLLRIETRDPQFIQDVQHWCEQKDVRFLHAQQSDQSVVVWLALPAPSTSSSSLSSISSKPPTEYVGNNSLPASSPTPSPRSPLSPASGNVVFSRDTDTRTPTLQPPIPIDSLIDLPVPLASNATQPTSSGSFSLPPDGLSHLSASSDSFEDLAPEPIPLNFCGLKCPMPIVQLSKQVREHPKHPLKVSADDPAFPVDLKAWCDIHGYIVQKEKQQGHVYHAWLHKP